MGLTDFLSKGISSGVSLEAPVPDFIPYACHYDNQTLLTKNGELLQVIKITGFSSEDISAEHVELRDVIRQAIHDNITDDKFAIWLHTIRRKKSLDPGGNFPAGFSDSLNSSWNTRHSWNSQYVNELYVTILHDSLKCSPFDPKDFIKGLAFWHFKGEHKKFVQKVAQKLTKAVDGALKTLEDFGASRLTIRQESSGEYHSEVLQFISKILNLTERPVAMPINDVAENLATHKVAFGFNTLEVINNDGEKRFGSIFTIKEYHEISSNAIDKFLQLPLEFIITQTIDFIDSDKAMASFKEQHYYLKVSEDKELSDASDLTHIMEDSDTRPTDFGQGQLTIMIIDTALDSLEVNVDTAAKALSRLGMIATRRDLRMEECFWSQLPGNFEFVTRRKPISASRIGGMASLYNFPAGQRSGNLWGPAVAAFHTAHNTPYFFNFHVGNCGHTAIMGPTGSGKTVLMNFLVAQAQKFNGRLFFFDQMDASKVFIKSLNGYYSAIDPNESSPNHAFNPLLIPDSPENREFLAKWLLLTVTAHGYEAQEGDAALCKKAIDHAYTIPKDDRKLSTLAQSFAGTPMEEHFSHWHSDGKYAHLFDNARKDTVPLDHQIYGFGMTKVVENKETLGPLLSYLFHRIEMLLDGTPTIVVLDEAWSLVNNDIFGPNLEEWLNRLQENNAIVVFSTQNMQNASDSSITPAIAENIATQIFLPNPDAGSASKAYQKVWGLSEDEYEMLLTMSTDRREFMLCQGGAAIIATLDLKDMKELHVLSGSEETVKIMEEVTAQHGENPEDWLSVFYEQCKK